MAEQGGKARGPRHRAGLVGATMAALAGILAAVPQEAAAGAWTQPRGEGVAIVSTGRQAAPISSLATGFGDTDKSFVKAYVEYGLRDRITVGGAIFGELDTTDLVSGSAAVSAFVRTRVWSHEDGHVASVQLGGSYPVESFLSDTFGASKPDSTPEIRASLLTGTGWWGDWGNAFVSSATGIVWRSEGTANEVRSEFTAGYEPWQCCLALFAVYGTQPIGESVDSGTATIAPSLVYRIWPEPSRNAIKPREVRTLSLQIGLSHDIMGGSDGLGLTFAVWKEF